MFGLQAPSYRSIKASILGKRPLPVLAACGKDTGGELKTSTVCGECLTKVSDGTYLQVPRVRVVDSRFSEAHNVDVNDFPMFCLKSLHFEKSGAQDGGFRY